MKVMTCKHEHIEIEYCDAEREAVQKAIVNGDWHITRSGPKIKNLVCVPDTFLILAHRPLTNPKISDKLP